MNPSKGQRKGGEHPAQRASVPGFAVFPILSPTWHIFALPLLLFFFFFNLKRCCKGSNATSQDTVLRAIVARKSFIYSEVFHERTSPLRRWRRQGKGTINQAVAVLLQASRRQSSLPSLGHRSKQEPTSTILSFYSLVLFLDLTTRITLSPWAPAKNCIHTPVQLIACHQRDPRGVNVGIKPPCSTWCLEISPAEKGKSFLGTKTSLISLEPLCTPAFQEAYLFPSWIPLNVVVPSLLTNSLRLLSADRKGSKTSKSRATNSCQVLPSQTHSTMVSIGTSVFLWMHVHTFCCFHSRSPWELLFLLWKGASCTNQWRH